MANNPDEESSPLLGTTDTKINESDPNAPVLGKVDESFLPPSPPPVPKVAQPQVAETYGGAADGLPLGVVGQPMMGPVPWNSGLFSCLGRNDEFHSSDLEVCEYLIIFYLNFFHSYGIRMEFILLNCGVIFFSFFNHFERLGLYRAFVC